MENSRTSRRNFLKITATGVVAAGVATTETLIPNPLNEAKPVMAAESTTKETYREPKEQQIQIEVNGVKHDLLVDTRDTLAETLRNQLQLTGTKVACDHSECGACTVLMDDIPVYACSTLAVKANGHKITTIEGISDGKVLHDIQQKFYDSDAYQCGFCTSGQIMALIGFLKKYPNATEAQISQSNAGNLCRCGAYANIYKVALEAAKGTK